MPPPPPAQPTHGRPSQTVDRVGDAPRSRRHRGFRPVGVVHRPALVDPPLVAAAPEKPERIAAGLAPRTPLQPGAPVEAPPDGLRARSGRARVDHGRAPVQCPRTGCEAPLVGRGPRPRGSARRQGSIPTSSPHGGDQASGQLPHPHHGTARRILGHGAGERRADHNGVCDPAEGSRSCGARDAEAHRDR